MMSHPQAQQKKMLELGEDDNQIKFQTTPSTDSESSFSSSPTSLTSFSKNFIFTSSDNNINSYNFTTKLFRRRDNKRVHKLNGFSDFGKKIHLNVSPRPWYTLKKWCGSVSLMANPIHDEFRKKKITGQQKMELEREVTVLQKMLAHEEKVHEYLEKLQHRQNGSALAIPNFLPPKMKELLAELAMVENEITRLESQINHLQLEVKHEKDVNLESKSKEWGRELSLNLPPKSNTRFNEKVPFETKALHFINKAIKGDYNLSMNEKSMNKKSGFLENIFHDERGVPYREVTKRSGLLKPPSPLREHRHPTPRRDRNLETMDVPPRVLSTPLHSEEENVQRLAPNKLSENIMKCLVFIFVRLLRTSRAMELEKSGPIARSTNFSMSFRVETYTNSKTSQMFQKDSRQQDPYGIFDSEESIPRDIGPYKNLVRFTSTSMDIKCIQNSSSLPLFEKLKNLMDGLQKVDLRFLSHQQKLAFWINMYNACIMHGFLQYGVPTVSSAENLLTLINKATLNIAGNTINAQAIEHFILRKPADALVKEILGKGEKNKKEMIVRELYGLETLEPNITFALCCGARSSPAVKIYTADGVIAELERSKLEYLQAAIIVTSTKKIALPELLVRNMNDFAQDKESLMEWVCHQLPTSGTLRKSIVDCFKAIHGSKASAIVEKIPFEFEFQYLLAI